MENVGATLQQWLMHPRPDGLTLPHVNDVDSNERVGEPFEPSLTRSASCPTPTLDILRQPRRVMILEDDVQFRRVLLELLEFESIEVSICESYAALREHVHDHSPVVVLADFWGLSHTALSPDEQEEIRDLARHAPTILLTGRAWATTADKAALGVSCILPKPVELDDVILQLRRCLAVALPGEQ
jgi:ActR/RegA family two-component response regulator